MCAGLSFCASRVIEELDPIAFRCGVANYLDSDHKEVDGANGSEYYRADDLDKAKEEYIAMKQSKLDALLEADDEEGRTRDEEAIASLTAEIAELEAHSF